MDALDALVAEIMSATAPPAIVAIDGVDGSGKTTFARELRDRLVRRRSSIIHLDDFLNPPGIRHARGRWSPLGFWLDTYDYPAFRRRIAETPRDTLAIVEGMFLQRDGLAGLWDLSVFLDVPFAETARRMAVRDGTHPDPDHPSMRRYVEGQRLYFAAARPWTRATHVIDNTDPAAPRLIRPRDSFAGRDGRG
ncbi:uridine kinase [Microbacterium sp. JZ31]|uniref:uridine kinase n=1 Tax=Microbacterium sp. JZ31 TaxID=1906274 RepID=UPI0019345CF2|nr:uridine kinase [Microbacterium sp. JZ31]